VVTAVADVQQTSLRPKATKTMPTASGMWANEYALRRQPTRVSGGSLARACSPSNALTSK
jgi:hypothetical protein